MQLKRLDFTSASAIKNAVKAVDYYPKDVMEDNMRYRSKDQMYTALSELLLGGAFGPAEGVRHNHGFIRGSTLRIVSLVV